MYYEIHQNVIDYLINYGYNNLLEIKEDEAIGIDEESVDFKKMISHYQSYFWFDYGIQPDGIIGPITRQMMTNPRCGCPDVILASEIAELNSWPNPCRHNLSVYADLIGLKTNNNFESIQDYEKVWYDCFLESERICDFHAVSVNKDDLKHYVAHAGSTSSGVLAWSEFPQSCNGSSANTRFGTSWNWSYGKFQDTALHEQGHGLGLPHGPSGSVMFWTIDRNHNGTWKDWDIKQLVDRYGKSITPEPPFNIPPPILNRLNRSIENLLTNCISIDGVEKVKRRLLIPESKEKLILTYIITKNLDMEEFVNYGELSINHFKTKLTNLSQIEIDNIIDKLDKPDFMFI